MDCTSQILIVDDQALGQAVLANLLEPEGYGLTFAATGAEALAKMRHLTPDLVLLDVMMPEMDGFEVCRLIRADPVLALIPVMMITALDDQHSLMHGIEVGADDFVTKPFNRTELRARVRTITRLNRFRIVLEEQRRAASERAKLLWAIERSNDGYLLLDAEDRPQEGNDQGWRYLGLERRPEPGASEPLITLARRHYQLVPEEAWACWPEPSSATRYLVRPERANTLWLQVHLLDLPVGEGSRRMVHLQDVTDKISAQRNIWTFHSFVSHKLRTPLTSLLGGMGLVHRQAQSLPPELAALVETAYDGAQRLREVVDAIFSYLGASAMCANDEGSPLAHVPDLVMRLGADLGIAAIAVDAALPHAARRLALGVRTLELVLTELLENARKFHPRNRPAIQVALRQQGEWVAIRVIDDGVTLTPVQLREIWEPYHQIDNEFAGQIPGVGLGLTTVAQICWSVGGSCRIVSRPDGPGLTVELVLPLAPDDAQGEEAEG